MTKPFPCCGCGPCCFFSGTLSYNTSSCVLTLTITTCRTDIPATDVSFVVTGPSGVVAATAVVVGNTLSWSLYKPALGSWSVSASLACPYSGKSYSQTYTAIVTACSSYCCSIKTPNTITVNSSAACCSFGNGTYVLSSPGSCFWNKSTVVFPSPPSSPCSSAACFILTQTNSGIFNTYYFYPRGIEVGISLDYSGGFFAFPTAFINYYYYAYRNRTFDGCTSHSPGAGISWNYRFNCEDGAGTHTPGPTDGDINFIGNYSPTPPPISYFPCGTSAPSLVIDYL